MKDYKLMKNYDDSFLNNIYKSSGTKDILQLLKIYKKQILQKIMIPKVDQEQIIRNIKIKKNIYQNNENIQKQSFGIRFSQNKTKIVKQKKRSININKNSINQMDQKKNSNIKKPFLKQINLQIIQADQKQIKTPIFACQQIKNTNSQFIYYQKQKQKNTNFQNKVEDKLNQLEKSTKKISLSLQKENQKKKIQYKNSKNSSNLRDSSISQKSKNKNSNKKKFSKHKENSQQATCLDSKNIKFNTLYSYFGKINAKSYEIKNNTYQRQEYYY